MCQGVRERESDSGPLPSQGGSSDVGRNPNFEKRSSKQITKRSAVTTNSLRNSICFEFRYRLSNLNSVRQRVHRDIQRQLLTIIRADTFAFIASIIGAESATQ